MNELLQRLGELLAEMEHESDRGWNLKEQLLYGTLMQHCSAEEYHLVCASYYKRTRELSLYDLTLASIRRSLKRFCWPQTPCRSAARNGEV